MNDTLIHQITLPSIPSLVSTAALDKEKGKIILKVINTTQHEEKTALHIGGFSIKNTIEVIELAGEPNARNTFDDPYRIQPQTKEFSFSPGGQKVYSFPPNSISIIKLEIDK